MKNIFLAFLMMLMPLIVPAQKTIEKPVITRDSKARSITSKKIEEELKRNYVKCYITGVLSDMSKGSTVIVCPSDFDVRTSIFCHCNPTMQWHCFQQGI